MKKTQISMKKRVVLSVLTVLLVITVWPVGGMHGIQAASSMSDLGINDTSPAAGAVGVDGAQPITIEFSQPVKKGTGNITIKRISDNKEAVAPVMVTSTNVTVDNSADPSSPWGTKVTINGLNLAGGGYYVLMDKQTFIYTDEKSFPGISDASRWTFWTTGVGAPTITQLSPLNSSTGVLPAANLKMNFSKDVYPASGTINIYKSSDDALVESISGLPSRKWTQKNRFMRSFSF